MNTSFFGLIRRLMRILDTPRSLTVFMLIDAEEWDQLVNLTVDPYLYDQNSIEKYRKDVLATEILRKAEFLPTSYRDTMDNDAVELLRKTEQQCFSANSRLKLVMVEGPSMEDVHHEAFKLIRKAAAFVKRTLGDLPEHLDGRFGPGTTFESKTWSRSSRRQLSNLTKLRHQPSRTPGVCSLLIDHAVRHSILGKAWDSVDAPRSFPVVRGNRFTTVSKDSKKKRGIAIEPGLNVFCQLGLGGEIKKRLKRIGLDLTTGQELHRWIAQEASLSGGYATIDLSNASNTVSIELVRNLLPELWYDALNAFRSPMMKLPINGKDSWLKLEMFSSMGNGYTFELETLIFASLIHACGGKVGLDSFVYGDDIIVPNHITGDLLALLNYCGFSPNQKKTYTHPLGIFRESCGGDYLHGCDVRPFYIKEEPVEPSDWIVIANQFSSWADKFLLPELRHLRNFAIDQIPTHVRNLRGPQALGDLLIHEPDHQKWSCYVEDGIRYFRVWMPVSQKVQLPGRDVTIPQRILFDRKVHYAITLAGPCQLRRYKVKKQTYRIYAEYGVTIAAALLGLPSDGVTPRNAEISYRIGKVSFS